MSVEALIGKRLIFSLILYVDETVFRLDGKRKWLHVALTKEEMLYFFYASRGKSATDAMEIFPHHKGCQAHHLWVL
ncbi:hypothetical protein IB49_09135 [Geobacillus sp. LC300]|nr:hypothetical protein IB49_09135 [Geobacillus sp. LC300]